ncbi:hypothetical protein BAUCODRAFT_245471 [Baudoinia panamericana UAMH 10762]|uniref:Kelch repeat protein n=1 Tax=Baudoinia panamericana (strain UAMH 10762) TaxID=717646 RepID=M2MQ23_BAUPA|nr:uncharacterized protein BAUCODRAFT_245471 [Baudoinia panamericana UAMH 10762]EMC93553.1 hypothetical protein BAUCODRAFT_245471 [Baudoinia panamericana UAMH 10762]
MAQHAVWTKVASHERLQRSSVSVCAIGSAAYVFGGELKPRQPRDNDVHMINLADGHSDRRVQTFSASKDSPPPRVGAAVATLANKMYMFSGRGGEAMAPMDEKGGLWMFDPSKEAWSFLSPSSMAFPEARSYHCMASDGKDTIYLHAGCPEKGRLSDLWAFDASEGKWTQLASAPGPPRGGASIEFVDGRLYRMNGFDGKTEQGGCLDVFDTISNSWSSTSYSADGTSGPGARSVSALKAVRKNGSTVLVTMFGESDPSSLGHQGAGKMLSDVWSYSLKEQEWAEVKSAQDVPQARGWFDAGVVEVDGTEGIVIVGGLGESNERLDDAWFLTLE